ncbi:MAG: penicillin-binding protein 2 [Acidobacteriota bacterium]
MSLFQDNRPLLGRLKILRTLFCFALCLMLGRLWHLAVVQFAYYEELALNNRIQTVPLSAPRGRIEDRQGRVLVDNTQALKLLVYRDDMADRAATVGYLARGLQESAQLVAEGLAVAEKRAGHYRPIQVRSNLPLDTVSYFMARQSEHPEVRVTQQPRRLYLYGDLAAHILGYVGEITSQQLQQEKFSGFDAGDVIGQFGVEATYNRHLAGQDGYLLVQVDSRGRMVKELKRQEPAAGKLLKLTLDLDLQMAAEEELGGSTGAIVALDPRNGEILALASQPSFDPNAFVAGMSEKEWKDLLSEPDRPLRNRALQSAFPPGSVFKSLLAAAGLEEGVHNSQTKVLCSGAITLYGHPFRCHKRGGHGLVHFRESIEYSCNIYYYLLGKKLGIDAITRFSKSFGLGQLTGIDLPGEYPGLAPSRDWKRKNRGEPWYAGDTISVSIGQGLISATPLQIARAMGILATGQTPRLHLARNASLPPFPGLQQEVSVSEKNRAQIRDAMWYAVNGAGTGRAARVEGFDVCGKTGTAQVIALKTKQKLSAEKSAAFEDHAWFAGFAPRDNPEVVVVVLVQRGGGGGRTAAPMAGKIFQKYFDKHRKDQKKDGVEVAI